MGPINVVSLSHSDDFDGIGSQAILYRYFSILNNSIPTKLGDFPEENVNLILLQSDYQDYLFYWAAILTGFKQKSTLEPLDFEKEWVSTYLELHGVDSNDKLKENFNMVSKESKERILKEQDIWKDIALVIVSDIGYNKTFLPLLPLLEKIKIPLAYFDHHTHNSTTRAFYKHYCVKYIVEPSRCATQIVHDFFLPNDPISTFIAELGWETDENIYDIQYSREIMAVISTYRKNWDELIDIVHKYATGVNFDNTLIEKHEQIQKWEDNEAEKMLRNLNDSRVTISTRDSVRFMIGISDLRAGRAMNFLEDALNSQLSVKLQIHQEEPLVLLTINIKSLNCNIRTPLLNVHSIAEHFGGGGHIHRAGFRFPSKYIIKGVLTPNSVKDLDIKGFLQEIGRVLAK